MNCPLCTSSNVALQISLEVSLIISQWEIEFGIDVRGEFGGVSQIEFYKCLDCTLGFFKPDSLAGSPALYEALEKIDWYYLPRKWEHDVALQDIKGSSNGIEIGCGFGAFVTRVRSEKNIPFEGCEQNPSAVRIGQANGAAIRLESLEDLVDRCPRAFDVVCSFQVLEHVTNPGVFLSSMCTLLRPGGKLILGLPNAESFLRHEFNLLDLPPHHMSRWTAEIMNRLQSWFPLRLARVAYQPLEETAVDRYLDAYLTFFRRRGLGVLAWPAIRSRLAHLIRHNRQRRFLRGQGFYASYVHT
jgi:SAM-dependent methyltransferase